MTPFDRDRTSDAAFERALLASARADVPPEDGREAWRRFAAALALVRPGEAPRQMRGGDGDDSGSDGGAAQPLPPHAVDGGGGVPSVTAGASRALGMKWLLLGVIAGGGLTAAVMTAATVGGRRGRSDAPGDAPAAVSSPVTVASRAPSSPAVAPPPVVDSFVPGTTAPSPSPPARSRHHARGRPHTLAAHGGAPSDAADGSNAAAAPSVDASILAAEVARIDAARTALASGAYDDAVRLVARYHRDFPEGALGPDADVVALEAIAANGDHAEVARRAALFLSRYPGDPHAARVKWLAAH